MLLHVFLLDAIACFAGEYHQLADYVGAAQVDAWVGFRIPALLGAPYCLREGDSGRQLVKDKVERAAQYRFYLQYLIAGVAQVVDGADDGKTSAHIGLETVNDAAVERRMLEFGIALIVG